MERPHPYRASETEKPPLGQATHNSNSRSTAAHHQPIITNPTSPTIVMNTTRGMSDAQRAIELQICSDTATRVFEFFLSNDISTLLPSSVGSRLRVHPDRKHPVLSPTLIILVFSDREQAPETSPRWDLPCRPAFPLSFNFWSWLMVSLFFSFFLRRFEHILTKRASHGSGSNSPGRNGVIMLRCSREKIDAGARA